MSNKFLALKTLDEKVDYALRWFDRKLRVSSMTRLVLTTDLYGARDLIMEQQARIRELEARTFTQEDAKEAARQILIRRYYKPEYGDIITVDYLRNRTNEDGYEFKDALKDAKAALNAVGKIV